ncbi:hypothetical protein JRQ81_008745 [Phrynocephalus forsythii]|uniref:MBD domain-containing protein n=1 Tax=Phrynocephalus forsythii TaxID=171643 RepID=A0A9Q1ASY8_9SAUR|nr:hypothetical protein JRQ81_008745 [Phrynocephalus forsythii]
MEGGPSRMNERVTSAAGAAAPSFGPEEEKKHTPCEARGGRRRGGALEQPGRLHRLFPPSSFFCKAWRATCVQPEVASRARIVPAGPFGNPLPEETATLAARELGAGRPAGGATARAGGGGGGGGGGGSTSWPEPDPDPALLEAMDRKRWECSALPEGWKREEVTRKSGLSAGKSDVYYYSPSGKKFRSKPQLARYLGNSMDLSTFDFRTGKMLMSKVNKNRQRMRYDCSSQAKGKPDLNTALPVRQTASIFKQPVTKITNHPSNKVKTDPQKAVDQPRQLFWEKKLSGLNAFDIAEELVKTMDLPKGLQGTAPEALIWRKSLPVAERTFPGFCPS